MGKRTKRETSEQAEGYIKGLRNKVLKVQDPIAIGCDATEVETKSPVWTTIFFKKLTSGGIADLQVF